jgi:hypothetical protein
VAAWGTGRAERLDRGRAGRRVYFTSNIAEIEAEPYYRKSYLSPLRWWIRVFDAYTNKTVRFHSQRVVIKRREDEG